MTKRRYPRDLYTKAQEDWCIEYEDITTFEPLVGDYEAGNCSFEVAAEDSLIWFRDKAIFGGYFEIGRAHV